MSKFIFKRFQRLTGQFNIECFFRLISNFVTVLYPGAPENRETPATH